ARTTPSPISNRITIRIASARRPPRGRCAAAEAPRPRRRPARTKEFPMTISTVTIVGAGYMGGGIAQVLAIAGFDVTIADVSVENANATHERLRQEARGLEDQGLYSTGEAQL